MAHDYIWSDQAPEMLSKTNPEGKEAPRLGRNQTAMKRRAWRDQTAKKRRTWRFFGNSVLCISGLG